MKDTLLCYLNKSYENIQPDHSRWVNMREGGHQNSSMLELSMGFLSGLCGLGGIFLVQKIQNFFGILVFIFF